jgi:hypothetical protein
MTVEVSELVCAKLRLLLVKLSLPWLLTLVMAIKVVVVVRVAAEVGLLRSADECIADKHYAQHILMHSVAATSVLLALTASAAGVCVSSSWPAMCISSSSIGSALQPVYRTRSHLVCICTQ